MPDRTAFQAQILEKLGAPLTAAVSEVAARQEEGATAQQDAERVAALLNRAVQMSIELANLMDLKSSESADSIRLTLAALSGNLIADEYRLHEKAPADGDLKRLVKSLETVLTFSDNFVPSAETTARLDNIAPGALIEDEPQVTVQYMNCMVPVISAIALYSFGRSADALLQEVTGALTRRADTISKALASSAEEDAEKRLRIRILQALGQLYAECHEEQTARIMAMDEQAQAAMADAGKMPMDDLWRSFELRAGMVAALAEGAGDKNGTGNAAAPETIAEKPAQSPPAETEANAGAVSQAAESEKTPETSLPDESEPAPSVQEEAVDDAPQSNDEESQSGGESDEGSYNPMSFFKPGSKPPPSDDDTGA